MSGRSRYLIRPQGTQTGNKGLRLGGAAQYLKSRSVSWVKKRCCAFLTMTKWTFTVRGTVFYSKIECTFTEPRVKSRVWKHTSCLFTQHAPLGFSLWIGGKRERERWLPYPLRCKISWLSKSFNVAAVTSDYWYTHGFAFILLLLRSLRHTMSIYFCGAIYYFYSSSVYISAAKREKIARHTLVSSLINLKRNLFEDKPENRSHTKVMNLHVASWGIHPILYFLRTPISLPHLY